MVALATCGSRPCNSLATTPAFHRHRAAVAAASGRFDDQLRAGRVDVCCALQQDGTVDAEPVQSGLDRAGVLTRVACGWSRCGRVLRASGGFVAGVCCGPGGREPATSATRAPLVSVSTSSSVDAGTSFGIQSRVISPTGVSGT
jgi:hypothetical protein